ncbi:MAG TPA: hypothetical protein DEO88_17915, partial [Syntrophobacteraceae bacterium]|nr:hypothetical protein [Syntrophobacteraceae bacterium]
CAACCGIYNFIQTVFNCEFIGFLNENETTVACLLHPAIHQQDLCHRSKYDRILVALGSEFQNAAELTNAERMLD